MFCSKCGTKIPNGAAFCHNCGTKTPTQQAQPFIQGAQPPVQQVQPYMQPPTQQVQQPMGQVPLQGGMPGYGGFQNPYQGMNYNNMFDMNRVGNKMNFVGFGAALFMFIFLFLPVIHYSVMGFLSFDYNLFQLGAFPIITAIILIFVVIATAFFSFIKMDTPILIAGIVATLFMFIITIIFICKGYSIKISFMGESKVFSASEAAEDGRLSITFGFIMLWISSLVTVFAGVCRKYIPALR